MTDPQNDSQGAGRFSRYTEDELLSAIDQLSAEVAMGSADLSELRSAQREAEKRELIY